MTSKQHARETLKISFLILVLAGFLLAISALARASDATGSEGADADAMQNAPEVSAPQQGPDTGYPQRRAARGARRKALLERFRLAKQIMARDRAVPAAVAPPASPLARIEVSFKLDPRLSGPTYGGERWVSPPTYTGASAQYLVDARVSGMDAKGRPVAISPKWTPADPEMVDVSPSEGDAVKITVKRAGESTLDVASQGISKKLTIKAEQRGHALQVQLSQKP